MASPIILQTLLQALLGFVNIGIFGRVESESIGAEVKDDVIEAIRLKNLKSDKLCYYRRIVEPQYYKESFMIEI